jgi:hypothetical protein
MINFLAALHNLRLTSSLKSSLKKKSPATGQTHVAANKAKEENFMVVGVDLIDCIRGRDEGHSSSLVMTVGKARSENRTTLETKNAERDHQSAVKKKRKRSISVDCRQRMQVRLVPMGIQN